MLGGGIGAGKGVVARLFADLGFIVISADEAGHAVLEPGGGAYAAVAERWPSVVVDGRIDRSRLAGIVFVDLDQLSELEGLTHPAIMDSINRRAAEDPGPVVVEVPVLLPLEDGWHRVFVDADEAVRVGRAVARGDREDDVRRRVAAQADRETWLAWADDVIENNGSIEELRHQVEELVGRPTG